MNDRTICFDFDGVLHSYASGWKGPDVIPDPPVVGMPEALARLEALGWKVVIQSSRARYAGGREAIKRWLSANGFRPVPVVSEKPPAEIYVDDRALRFDGSVTGMLAAIEGWPGPWHHRAQPRVEP